MSADRRRESTVGVHDLSVRARFVHTGLAVAQKFGYGGSAGFRPGELDDVLARALARLRPMRRSGLRADEWELLLFRREFLKALAGESRLDDLRRALDELDDATLVGLCDRIANQMEFDPRSPQKTASAFDPLLLSVEASEGEPDAVRDARLSFVVAFMKAQEDGLSRARTKLARVAKAIASPPPHADMARASGPPGMQS